MGDIIATVCFIAAGSLATAAAIEDTRTHLLRNIYTLPIIAIALIGLTTAGWANDLGIRPVLTDMTFGAAWFAGPWLITHLIAPSQIGFGDIKLAAGLGLYIGWLNPSLGLLGFFATCLAFGATVLVAKAASRDQLPFGPAIVAGAAGAVAFGVI